MKILQACGTPLAGVHIELAAAINRHTSHESRVLSGNLGWHGCYKALMPELRWWTLKRSNEINEALDWADVVHCHANVSPRMLGRPEIMGSKIVVFQWHGMQILRWESLFKPGDEKHVRWAHIGQGWIGFSKQANWFARFRPKLLPNVISVDDELHAPIEWAERVRRRIAFAPSTWRRAPNDKGVEATRGALRSLDLDVIHGVTFDQCMRRKAAAWVGVDEVATPMYHKSGLELLSLGVACVEKIGPEAEDALKAITGASVVPFVRADAATLRATVSGLLDDEDRCRQIGEASREWMSTYYHPRDVVRMYLEFYGAAP